MANLRSDSMDRMFQVFLSLQSVEECYAFFEDLCTVKELKDLAQRLDVACLLSQGLSYQAVGEQVSVSSATISRVKRCLEYGSGGYQMAIQRMNAGEMSK